MMIDKPQPVSEDDYIADLIDEIQMLRIALKKAVAWANFTDEQLDELNRDAGGRLFDSLP